MSTPRRAGRLVRVLIADDSPVVREFLREIIDVLPDMLVVGTATNGLDTVRLAKALRPDLITLDINMPELDGLGASRQIMCEAPAPIAIVTSAPVGSMEETTYLALESGAVDVIAKPSRIELFESPMMRAAFVRQLRNVAGVNVVGMRHGRGAPVPRSPSSAPPPLRPRQTPTPRGPSSVPPSAPLGISARASVIGIGASTGGPPCLRALLAELAPKKSPPIVLVQHMSAQFLPSFARWLNESCKFDVRVAESGQRLVPGNVYVAPADRHVIVDERWRVVVTNSAPVEYQKPSVDVLFHSLADVFGDAAIGVLLTGMGRDGAEGLLELRRRGASTIGQNEESCLVYGMPAAAAELGASRITASPLHIGRLLRRVEWHGPSQAATALTGRSRESR